MNLNKNDIFKIINNTGIVPVIRASSSEIAFKTSKAVIQGGINIIEITMTVPGVLDVIRELRGEYKKDILIGAGSIIDSESTAGAIRAGVDFIVSPIFDLEIIRFCNRYNILSIPGAMTPTEVKNCLEAGADIIKIFPATVFGPKIIKSIKGPLPQANLLPTGGVDLFNVNDWIKVGSFAVGVGTGITAGSEEGNYEKVKKTSAMFLEKIQEAKSDI